MVVYLNTFLGSGSGKSVSREAICFPMNSVGPTPFPFFGLSSNDSYRAYYTGYVFDLYVYSKYIKQKDYKHGYKIG